ncbi:hypothetical protein [Streptomyces sp. AGS-58]
MQDRWRSEPAPGQADCLAEGRLRKFQYAKSSEESERVVAVQSRKL